MARDPYADTIRSTGFTPPSGNFSLPPIGATQGAGNASLEAYQYSPEELDRMIAEGYVIHEDGSMSPPGSFGKGAMGPPPVFTSPPPSAGAMTAAGNGGGMGGAMAPPSDPFAAPIFAPHMSIRNPPPKEVDPLKRMMRDPNRERPGPREGMNLSVPGGASIQNGMPMAAPPPGPPPNIKTTNTYNVQMAPSEESAGRLLQTEQVRGQNKQAQREYDEMNRSRKVNLMRGFLGRR